MRTRESRTFLSHRHVLPLLAGFALAVGCGEKSDKPASAVDTSAEIVPATTQSSGPKIHFSFDLLGGRDKIVRVYRGPEKTTQDKETIGAYYDGDSATADCQIKGRTVTSDTSEAVHEEPKSSDIWVRLTDVLEGQQPFATIVYTDLTNADLTRLETCPE